MHVCTCVYISIIYISRFTRAERHRDKNSLFAVEKPADWSKLWGGLTAQCFPLKENKDMFIFQFCSLMNLGMYALLRNN